jgi:hypothetical protein
MPELQCTPKRKIADKVKDRL